MEQQSLAAQARFIGLVAAEAADEADAIERHPEVIDALNTLADHEELREAFGANGHDPAAFVKALAEGLAPYRQEPLDDAPELVGQLAFVAQILRQGPSNRSTPLPFP